MAAMQPIHEGGGNMCPACIENAALTVAAAGSAGGILAVYIARLRMALRLGLLRQSKVK
jgi:hypothetical protein